jgi:hypothetical protein
MRSVESGTGPVDLLIQHIYWLFQFLHPGQAGLTVLSDERVFTKMLNSCHRPLLY